MTSDKSEIYMDCKKNEKEKKVLMQEKSKIHNGYIFKYASYTPYIGDEFNSGKILYVIGDLYIGEVDFPQKKGRDYPSDNFCSKIMSCCCLPELIIEKKKENNNNRRPRDGRSQRRIDFGVFTKIQADIEKRELDVTKVAFYTFYFDQFGKMGNSEGERGDNLKKRKEALTVVIKELKPKEIVLLGRVNAFIKGRLKNKGEDYIYNGKSFDDFAEENKIKVKELSLKNLKKDKEIKEASVIEAMDSFNGYFKQMDESFFLPIANNFAHIRMLFQILNKKSVEEIKKLSYIDLANIMQFAEVLNDVSSRKIDKLSLRELLKLYLIFENRSLTDKSKPLIHEDLERIRVFPKCKLREWSKNIILESIGSIIGMNTQIRRFPGKMEFGIGFAEKDTDKFREIFEGNGLINSDENNLKINLQCLIKTSFENISRLEFSQIKRMAKLVGIKSFKDDLEAREYFTNKMIIPIDVFPLFACVKKMRSVTNEVRNEGTDYDYMFMLDLLKKNDLFVSKKSVPLVLRYIRDNLGASIPCLEYKPDIIHNINDYLRNNQGSSTDCCENFDNNLENVYSRFKNYERENKKKNNKFEERDEMKIEYTKLMTERIFEPNNDVKELVEKQNLEKCCKHKWQPKYTRLKILPELSDSERLNDLYNRKGLHFPDIW